MNNKIRFPNEIIKIIYNYKKYMEDELNQTIFDELIQSYNVSDSIHFSDAVISIIFEMAYDSNIIFIKDEINRYGFTDIMNLLRKTNISHCSLSSTNPNIKLRRIFYYMLILNNNVIDYNEYNKAKLKKYNSYTKVELINICKDYRWDLRGYSGKNKKNLITHIINSNTLTYYR